MMDEADETIARLRAEIDEKLRENERLRACAWRPISEIHEDYGECVLMDIEEPSYLEIGSSLDPDFDASQWTHFAPVPSLSMEQANKLREEMERARAGQ